MNGEDTIEKNINIPRLIFVALFILSLFTLAKSFVARSNVEQWSDDILRMFIKEQAEARRGSDSMGEYLEKINAIQKQWAVMRHVGVAMAVLSFCGIFLISGRKQKKPHEIKEGEGLGNQPVLDRRLMFALACTAIAPCLNLILQPNFGLFILPCITLIIVFPVLVRGSRQRRFFAIVLMVAAGYFAYKGWATVIQPRLQ